MYHENELGAQTLWRVTAGALLCWAQLLTINPLLSPQGAQGPMGPSGPAGARGMPVSSPYQMYMPAAQSRKTTSALGDACSPSRRLVPLHLRLLHAWGRHRLGTPGH